MSSVGFRGIGSKSDRYLRDSLFAGTLHLLSGASQCLGRSQAVAEARANYPVFLSPLMVWSSPCSGLFWEGHFGCGRLPAGLALASAAQARPRTGDWQGLWATDSVPDMRPKTRLAIRNERNFKSLPRNSKLPVDRGAKVATYLLGSSCSCRTTRRKTCCCRCRDSQDACWHALYKLVPDFLVQPRHAQATRNLGG